MHDSSDEQRRYFDESEKQLRSATLTVETISNILYYYRNEFLKAGFYGVSRAFEKVAIKLTVKYTILVTEMFDSGMGEATFPVLTKPIYVRSKYVADSAFHDILYRLQFIKDMIYVKEAILRYKYSVTDAFLECIELENMYPSNEITKMIMRETLDGIRKMCTNAIGKKIAEQPKSIKDTGSLAFATSNMNCIEITREIDDLYKRVPVVFDVVPFVNEACMRIGKKAFSENNKLDFANCAHIQDIGNNAFNKCTKLKKIDMQMYVWQVFKKRTFTSCISLQSVDIKNTHAVYIGAYCFANCTGLKRVRLPKTLIYIGVNAFLNTKLEYIRIPSSCIFCGHDMESYKTIGLYKKIVKDGVTQKNKVVDTDGEGPQIDRRDFSRNIKSTNFIYSLCKPIEYYNRKINRANANANLKLSKKDLENRDIQNIRYVNGTVKDGFDDSFLSLMEEYNNDKRLHQMMMDLYNTVCVDVFRSELFLFAASKSIEDTIIKFRLKMEALTSHEAREKYQMYYGK